MKSLGPIPDHLKTDMRRHFLSGLKDNSSLDYYELDLFKWFISETEKTWKLMNEEENKYIKEQIDAGAEEINDSGILTVDYYQDRMRSSHVVFLTSLLEGAMKRECERVALALGEKILFKLSELKGDAWSVRKLFLENYCSFRIPEERWAPIRDLLTVRNAFVHHSGDVSLLTDEQIAKLRKINGVSVNSFYLIVESEFLNESLEAVGDLTELLNKEISGLIERAMKPGVI